MQISLNDTAEDHILEVAWTCGVQRAELLCDLNEMSFQVRPRYAPAQHCSRVSIKPSKASLLLLTSPQCETWWHACYVSSPCNASRA